MKTFLILLCFLFLYGVMQAQPALKWIVGYSKELSETPEEFVAAVVPGAVQLDIAKAEKYGPYYFAENWKDYLWMEDMFFTYKTSFRKPKLNNGEQLFFVSKGIDYKFDIYINQQKILSREGMFSWVNLEVTPYLLEENELKIVIHPVPKSNKIADRTQANHSVKPAVSYEWDWHPRLVPSGIWDETYLEIRKAAHVEDVAIDYQLNDALTEAKVNLTVTGKELVHTTYRWTIIDKDGEEVFCHSGQTESLQKEPFGTSLKNLHLWWPHDYGEPYLYSSVFELMDTRRDVIQKIEQKVGFKKVRLVVNEGAWDEPPIFPKTRSCPPAQFEINGVPVFAKGTNWVNPEIFPGTITSLRYEELINRAVEANFNIFRIWGGGIVNKEPFFEQCDAKGVMVWQEFPLACNNYPDDPHYLKILEQEATAIVNRLKKHVSLVLWGGGNELFNEWSGMTDQSLPLRLLNSVTYRLNPQTPFIATSPLYGMGHGHYVFKDKKTGEEVYALMQRARNTAYTEFGMPSPAPIEVLKKIIPAGELWPPKEKSSWKSHHAFGAWEKDSWLMPDMIQDYFGEIDNLETLVEKGQIIQSEGYKAIYEEARRQKPYCAMALNWCYNEPWPTAANNSLLSYPNIPKPAFYAVKNSCRPVCSSAKITKFKWKEGENFATQLWMLNDRVNEVSKGKMVAKLVTGDTEIEIMEWQFDRMQPYKNQEGPVSDPYQLPAWNTDMFKLVLEVEGRPEYRSEYTLLYENSMKPH